MRQRSRSWTGSRQRSSRLAEGVAFSSSSFSRSPSLFPLLKPSLSLVTTPQEDYLAPARVGGSIRLHPYPDISPSILHFPFSLLPLKGPGIENRPQNWSRIVPDILLGAKRFFFFLPERYEGSEIFPLFLFVCFHLPPSSSKCRPATIFDQAVTSP